MTCDRVHVKTVLVWLWNKTNCTDCALQWPYQCSAVLENIWYLVPCLRCAVSMSCAITFTFIWNLLSRHVQRVRQMCQCLLQKKNVETKYISCSYLKQKLRFVFLWCKYNMHFKCTSGCQSSVTWEGWNATLIGNFLLNEECLTTFF